MRSDIELLFNCVNMTLSHADEVEARVLKDLETSAATSLVMATRVLRLQKIVMAVGMFSLYEAMLQTSLSWEMPFKMLKEFLIEHKESEVAQRFDDYQNAINALKHGHGPSYERLLRSADRLDFQIKRDGERFISEGDVSEVDVLIDVDRAFVVHCAELIRQTVQILREKIPDQLSLGTLIS